MATALSADSFTFLFSDIYRMFRQCWEDELDDAGFDLTTGDIKLLIIVGQADGSRQNILAAKLGVEPMTVSAVLDRLEQKGLILRLPDPSDRRANLIKQTEAGRQLTQTLEPLAEEVLKRLTYGLDLNDLGVAASTLCKMRKNLAASR